MAQLSDADEPNVNVAHRLAQFAAETPGRLAVAEPLGKRRPGRKRRYNEITFAELEADSNRIASGLLQMGVPHEARIVLMVRPGIDFISLVFALLKSGVTMVLVDPGMGRGNLLRCLQEVEPEGFVAISLAQAVRCLFARRFSKAKHNVTVGRRWFWGGSTLEQVRQLGDPRPLERTTLPSDSAAIIFTTGSTGPPKGVLYSHGNFDHQVTEIGTRYQIDPGEIDLPGFPLFGLFNCAMGVSTIIPDMDPTRPAEVDPENVLEAVRDWDITQSFGSPALWNTVSTYCEAHQKKLPTIRRVLSAGAPVPPHVLERVKKIIHPDGDIFTPYGATEALPVASISATEVLQETAPLTNKGRGVCVGAKFPGIEWKVISIDDAPIASIDGVRELPAGEIGELMVKGAVVTTKYVIRPDACVANGATSEHNRPATPESPRLAVNANKLHKVADGGEFWHRMGDVGYLEPATDERPERFWLCGRKTHRLLTESGPMFTIPCEAIMNTHEKTYRSALVGLGPPGSHTPVLIAEPLGEYFPAEDSKVNAYVDELKELAAQHKLTRPIEHFLIHRSLPVDIRHNSKIFREQLVGWAAKRI